MLSERGFKFKNEFYDNKILEKMTYNETEFLISQVNEEIKEASDFVFPYSDKLKNREEVPESVKKKLGYKDALVYFVKDLKELIHAKKMGIEKAFYYYCKDIFDENEFAKLVNEAEKEFINKN